MCEEMQKAEKSYVQITLLIGVLIDIVTHLKCSGAQSGFQQVEKHPGCRA